MQNQKVAAIVPALNEEGNVGDVLKVLLQAKILDEVILINDGSTDRTGKIGEELGVKVINRAKPGGKGNAMREGVEATDAGIIVFFDADLIGLAPEHASLLVEPIIKGEAAMCAGIRQRWGGLPKLWAMIDPLLAIGGERAMKRELFEALPPKFIQGFAVETALNYYCYRKKLKVQYPILKGLTVIVKEKKWGFWKGFKNRIKMLWQMLRIRFVLLASRGEFK